MIRKLLLATAFLAALGLSLAQTTQYINPTTGSGADAISRGTTQASVNQTVKLILPQATALHLDATTLTFDFTQPSAGPVGLPYACIYAEGADVRDGLGNDFWGQTQVMPGGTKYDLKSDGTLSITGDRALNYPPALTDDEGELVEGSKDHFVCYQSFVLQLFSNFDHWDLQVNRADTGSQPIEHLYIQGNVCSDYGKPTGLYALNDDSTVHLIPKSLTAGTTGDRVSEACGNVNTSWLDVLGVVAVKVNSDRHGESTANLTYTLMSSDTEFGNTN